MGIQLNFKCSESWDKMPNSDKGKFCDKCTKNVFDLTDKSEVEIHQLYIENNGNLCGKIKQTQLGINYLYQQQKYALAKFCAALFLAFGGLLFNYELKAQGNLQTEITDNKEIITIKGQVLDIDTKEALIGVSVFVKQDSLIFGTLTDIEGNYHLEIKKNELESEVINLEFVTIEYKTLLVKEIGIKENIIVNQELKREPLKRHEVIMLLGGIGSNYNPIDYDPNSHRSSTFNRIDIEHSPY